MKTLLIGNFGADNIGDELILASSLESYPSAVVMTSNPEFSQTFTETSFEAISMPPTGFRSLVFAMVNPQGIPEQVRDVKRIIFPGGGLFAITPKAYFIWSKVIDCCAKTFPQVSITMEHQGFDEPKNIVEKWCLKKALSRVDKVTVRDENSAKVVEKYSSHKPKIVGDRVQVHLQDSPAPSTQHSRILLVNAMSPYDKASVQQKFPEHKITEIAFGKGDLGIRPKTKTELFSFLSQADIVIGERFHSLVLGNHFCLDRTYLLRTAYSQKVKDFQERKKLEVI